MKKSLAILLAVMIVLLSVNMASTEEETGGVKAGDIVTFGHYPQVAEGTDETPIEWIVLEVQDGKAFLLSKYGLYAKPYNEENTDITWEKCTLRTWLNNDFLQKAFTGEEQTAVLVTEVDNSNSQRLWRWSTNGGNNTQDQIFLLSYTEAERYLSVRQEVTGNRPAGSAPTPWARKNGAYQSDGWGTTDGENAGQWWLRNPGSKQCYADYVNQSGALYNTDVDKSSICVRPAMWIDLESETFKSENPQYGAAPQAEAEPFVFRDGITWGMSPEEVYQIEGEPNVNSEHNGFQTAHYFDVRLSKYTGCNLTFAFKDNRLDICVYNTDQYSPEMAETLVAVYSAKYGEPTEVEPNEVIALSDKISPGYFTEESVKYSEYYKWDIAGGTQIWMLRKENDDSIAVMYVSPELWNEQENEFDFTGV